MDAVAQSARYEYQLLEISAPLRAVKLLTYKEGVEAFRVSNRLSDGDRAKLMGETLMRVYNWTPGRA